MNVIKDNKLISMSYEDVCADLGYIPETKFVKVTNRGTISFTAGKMLEVKALYRNTVNRGYKPSVKLTNLYNHI